MKLIKISFICLTLLILIFFGYFLTKFLVAEYYFQKSIISIKNNNIKETYDYQKKAININSNNENYRLNFSRTNLILANSLASKPTNKITNQDKQAITQAVQAAISEAKATISLNPNKASNWDNLAFIYRNINSLIQNANAWAISSYQKAIVLDPKNPVYRLNLGGVYYSMNRYEDAMNYFQQAIGLKPNWANAYYNFAWAAYQNKNYERAVSAMNNVIKIENLNKNEENLEKAKKELEQFKQKLILPNTKLPE